LLNRDTAQSISAPGLIVHLIGEHHFLEGKGSPYRVDPLRLARVLGLTGKKGKSTSKKESLPF
jgi:hypothetical protein